ncbi:malonyl-CoA decarboxylase [Pikeienuella piscinae]|uniref:Malonyl-CoA decarboxylase n=1 Tax=Pikeienuella piscinae TaxID=2748098 RepID=A0A7L5BUE4_9RHOB|nr:malonyl-CoA decarboxylase [Pikeienuella piscinae]QIE54861.1 malonyl-CoA decarboxylase [Pikeienuella piscinae]
MTLLADLLTTLFERARDAAWGGSEDERTPEALADALVARGGEAGGFILARALLDRYALLDEDAKRAFFVHLTEAMDVDPGRLTAAAAAYAATPDKPAYAELMEAAEPPRQELIRRLNRAPGATKRLVEMRNDLRRIGGRDPSLGRLDLDFLHLFVSWFNRGFLVLRPIDWDTPASVLEKIIAYEAVHEISSWEDLRRRLAPADRRCFAFFHPAMADDPLIFVEVALTRGVPGSIVSLLAEDRKPTPAHKADTAVFYSISNCQPGLAGVSFGNLLIKQVAEDLGRALPGLKSYVTLSPIPGLLDWLKEDGREADSGEELKALTAEYLLNAKRADGAPRDPVARFHLSNGALVHAIHADADPSPRGMAQSGGAMVNYLYDLDRIAENQESFAARGPVAASKPVRTLAEAGAKLVQTRSPKNGKPAL